MSGFQGRKSEFLGLILWLFVNGAEAKNITHGLCLFQPAEVTLAAGMDWYNKRNTQFIISPSETDKVNVSQSSAYGSWQVGLGYSIFEDAPRYFHRLLLGLNVYQTSSVLKGFVWQYELPQFNNYHFKAPIKSTRLMIDFRPSFFTWRLMEPYLIAGIGVAWNSVSYKEVVTSADINPDSSLGLSTQTNSYLAWNAGAGCKVALTNKLTASLEYIYAMLGHGNPAQDMRVNRLASTPTFTLQSQSVLFGLNLRL